MLLVVRMVVSKEISIETFCHRRTRKCEFRQNHKHWSSMIIIYVSNRYNDDGNSKPAVRDPKGSEPGKFELQVKNAPDCATEAT